MQLYFVLVVDLLEKHVYANTYDHQSLQNAIPQAYGGYSNFLVSKTEIFCIKGLIICF